MYHRINYKRDLKKGNKFKYRARAVTLPLQVLRATVAKVLHHFMRF